MQNLLAYVYIQFYFGCMDTVNNEHPCSCELCQPNLHLGGDGPVTIVVPTPLSHVENDQKDETNRLRLLDAATRQFRWLLTGTVHENVDA